MKGQTKINLDLHVADDLSRLLRRLDAKYCYGTVGDGASDQFQYHLYDRYEAEDVCGIPALGALGYVSAFIIVMYVFIKHFFSNK